MHQLVGKSFLSDTSTTTTSWLEQYIPSQDQRQVQAFIDKAIKAKKPFELAHQVIQADRTLGWTFSRAIPIFNAMGEITEWFGTASDITEHKQAEEALRQSEQRKSFLLRLTDALRSLDNPVAIESQAVRVLGEYLGVNRIGYAKTQEDEKLVAVTLHYKQDVPGIEGLYRYEDYGPQLLQDMQMGKTVVRPDIARDSTLSDAEKAAHATLQLGATVHVPLVKQGRLEAILFVHSQQAHPWSVNEVSLIEETADRIWTAVEAARVEGDLQVSEKRLRLATEAAQLASWEWDLVTDTVYWNEQHFRLLGMAVQSEPLQSDAFLNHIHPDDRSWLTALLTKSITEQSLYDTDFRVIREDSAIRWMHGYGRVTVQEQDQPLRMSGLMFDITDRKEAEVALRETDRRKDEFLAMLAHELRNPLSTLHNTLLLLRLTRGQDETLSLDRALGMMSREVNHLNRMIDDLLDVSRISQGKIQLHKERLDIGKLIREALEAARSQFASRGQALTIKLPKEPIWVDGDATRLTQVVRNLTTNAAKYTPDGGQIDVTLEQQKGQAVVRIRDSGTGIAAEQLQAIFEVFVQVSASLDRPQGGLGLGLAVVKQLVELHGGRVGVDSLGLGHGSEFTVSLPSLPDGGSQHTSAGAGHATKAGRILVVDDNADLALTTAMLLRHKQYEAHTCLSGPDALAAVESLQPAAVLLDLGMPGMDGFATCRRLRALDWGKHGVIVALSGYGQEEDKNRTRDSGFDGHLVKPLNLQALTELLTKLLSISESGT